jgi:hypothetical protein
LSLVKSEKFFGTTFKRDGHMEQIDRSLTAPARVRLAQLVSAPKNVCPQNSGMHEYLFTKIVLDSAECSSNLFFADLPERGEISKRISDFDTM